MVYLFLFLIFHLVLNAVLFILIRKRVLKASIQIFPISLFVPIFGVMIYLSAEYMTRRKRNGIKSLEGIHSFTLDEDDYRRIHLFHDNGIDSVIPLEEAISINNAKIRRQFMMNIVNERDEDYTSLLQKAKRNDDVEVVHYASTAIMELMRKYELNIQKCGAAYELNQQDVSALDAFIKAYKIYISSGLVEEKVLDFQREKYGQAMKMRIVMGNTDMELYCDAVENQLELRNFESAQSLLEEAIKKWPNMEAVWKLQLKYYQAKRDREGMLKTISEIQASGLFLSKEFRDTISFWLNVSDS